MTLSDIASSHHHFRTHGAQVADLLVAHLVRDHHAEGVTLLGGNQCECQSGVAGGGFHNVPAGLQPSVLLGRLNHGHSDPVLD